MTKQNEQGSIIVIVLSVAIVLGLIGLLFYVATNRSGTPTPNNDTVRANCSNLALSKGSSSGAAGTIYWHAVITNNGDYACRLTGYPAAFMGDSATLSIGATSNSLYPPVTTVLTAHGGQAHTVIGLPEPSNFGSSVTCTQASSSTLQLFLPGLETPLTADFGESACPRFTATALQPGA